MSNLRDLLKRIRQWDALDIPDSDGAHWKREIDAALEQPEPDAIEQALAHAEAFSRGHDAGWQSAMLCAALTQAEQEPFGYIWPTGRHPEFRYTQQMRDGVAGMPLYTNLPQRPAEPKQEPVADAMKTVIKAMQADPDYAWSWHCNVAMAFADAGGDPYTANQGAARFMRLLANVDPAHELPPHPPRRKQEQEPVAWRTFDGEGGYDYRTYDDNENYRDEWDRRNPNHKGWVEPLYTHPPRREWRSLSEEEFGYIHVRSATHEEFARAVEAALKEKNHHD
jgi:hypothetical protein